MMRPVLTREEYLSLRNSEEQQAVLKAVRDGKTVAYDGQTKLSNASAVNVI